MNSLTIPSSPNWFLPNVMVSAPDKTLVFASNNKIIIINPQPVDKPADIKVIHNAHLDKTNAIAINPNWGKPSKWVASIGADKNVKLWDLDRYELINHHKAHELDESPVVGVAFSGNDQVVTVTDTGNVTTWNFVTNTFSTFEVSLRNYEYVMCISLCPHAPWLLALGVNGVILLVDIRSGKVKSRIKKYKKKVFSMSWCPAPINVFPQAHDVKTKQMSREAVDDKIICDTNETDANICEKIENLQVDVVIEDESDITNVQSQSETGNVEKVNIIDECESDEVSKDTQICSTEDIGDNFKEINAEIVTNVISDKDNEIIPKSSKDSNKEIVENVTDSKKSVISNDSIINEGIADTTISQNTNIECTPKPKKVNPWINLKHADDDEIPAENYELSSNSDNDFLKDCMALRQQIAQTNDKKPEVTTPVSSVDQSSRKILKARKKDQKEQPETVPVKPNDIETIEEIIENEPEERPESRMDPAPADADISENNWRKRSDEEPIPVFKPTEDNLLAVALEGGNILVIRGSDGTIESSFHVEPKNKRPGSRSYRSGTDKWMSVLWVAPSIILSSGSRGELLQWDLANIKNKGEVPKRDLVHQDHTNHLFSIAANIQFTAKAEDAIENWKEHSNILAWTVGQERSLLFTTIDNKRDTISCYPTVGHCVFSMTNCQVNPHKAALGFGDGNIRLWDLSMPHLQYVFMKTASIRMNGRIETLAWHNTDETILAFGVEDGKIGLLNANSISKAPTMLKHNFKKPIFKLEWGPLDGDVDNLALYVCTSFVVAIYDISKPKNDPEIFKLPETDYITDMAWKPDLTIFAVGTKNGQIHLYTKELELICTLYHCVKAIQTLCWHPQATAEDEEVSPKESYLAATCSTDSTISIFNLSNILNDKENLENRLVCTLKGHNKQIHKFVWNPHENGILASISEDGRTNIWNVDKEEIISTFINDLANAILTGIWSPINKDYLITAGRELSVRVWKIEDHPPKTDEDLKLQKNKAMEHIQTVKSASNYSQLDKKAIKQSKILTLPSHRMNNLDDTIEDCRLLFKLNSTDNADERKAIMGNNDVLQLFGNVEDTQSLMKKQYEQHKVMLKSHFAQHTSLWRGDIGEAIKDAISSGYITPWLISMAPMVSPVLWKEACEAYAIKLEQNPKSDPIEVSSYYIATHNFQKAIDVLCDRKMYKEALALAKCRIPSNTDMADDILKQWATYSISTGRFANTAQSFIVLKNYEEAAKALYKLNSKDALELAMELAERCENTELYNVISLRYKVFVGDGDVKSEEKAMKEELKCEDADQSSLAPITKATKQNVCKIDVEDKENVAEN